MPGTDPKRRDFRKTSETQSFSPLPAAIRSRSSSHVPSLKLSAEALAIVQCEHRYVEVLACAGSGKTTVLCERVRWLLMHGVAPDQILILSFSRAATAEVRNKLALPLSRLSSRSLSPAPNPKANEHRPPADLDMERINISTCHAFGRSLSSDPGKPGPKVLKPKQTQDLLARAVAAVRKNLGPEISSARSKTRRGPPQDAGARQFLDQLKTSHQLKQVARLFGHASASRQPLAELVAGNRMFAAWAPHATLLKQVRARYRRLKAASAMIDYADMLKLATRALRRQSSRWGRPERSASSGHTDVRKYRYVLVDEYQDSSAAQVHLVAALARALPDLSLMVFGDKHQSIFRFTGATHTPLASVLSEVLALPLSRSHRLTQPMADAATQILRAGGAEVGSILGRAGTSHAGKPVLVSSESLSDSLDAVSSDVAAKLANGTSAYQIAVLARTNATLREVEAQLLQRGVATHRKGLEREPQHVLNVLALAKCVERMPKQQRRPDISDLQALLPGVQAKGKLWQTLCRDLPKVVNPTFEGRYIRCADLYLSLLDGVNTDRERRDEVRRWIPFCRKHADAKAMRAEVRAMAQKPTVMLTTIHQAKGNEWDCVYIVGVADGEMPNYLALVDHEALVEELNLMHVAVTRARESLRLYFAPVRHARSHQRFDKLSRFLSDPQVQEYFEVEHR